MYIPKSYHMDPDEARQFMTAYPFALLITADAQRPVATHLPVEIQERNGTLYATGHIAYGNRQKQMLGDDREVLLVFQGPHTYISSSWYAAENVPTWDYLAVHAYGTARIQTPDELKAALDTMLTRYEAHRDQGRLWHTFHPEFLEREIHGIVGMEIAITAIQAAAKMSQNRDDTDYRSIVSELEHLSDADAQRVAQWMRQHRPHVF